LITGRAVYPDVLTRLWSLMDTVKDPGPIRDIHAKLLLLFTLGQHVPGGDLRGFQLHLAEEIAEMDFRFEALKPYLKPNPPRFDAAAK
jgi:hypothetical protein